MAGLLLVALAHTASATNYFRITGSTAFRGATSNAILHIFDAGVQYAYDGSSFTGANYQIFVGTISGTSTIVKTNWSGSVEGVRDVSQSNSLNFFNDSTPVSSGGTGSTSAGTYLTETTTADVDMADCSPVFHHLQNAGVDRRGCRHHSVRVGGQQGCSGRRDEHHFAAGARPLKGWLAFCGSIDQ